jgi:hypothetical protein
MKAKNKQQHIHHSLKGKRRLMIQNEKKRYAYKINKNDEEKQERMKAIKLVLRPPSRK